MAIDDHLIIFILLIVICETAAISCVKKYHLDGNVSYFVGAIILYGMVCYLLDKSFNYSTMGITNVVWSGISILAVAIAGVLFFREKVHLHDVIAGILITIGILIFRYTE